MCWLIYLLIIVHSWENDEFCHNQSKCPSPCHVCFVNSNVIRHVCNSFYCRIRFHIIFQIFLEDIYREGYFGYYGIVGQNGILQYLAHTLLQPSKKPAMWLPSTPMEHSPTFFLNTCCWRETVNWTPILIFYSFSRQFFIKFLLIIKSPHQWC